MEIREGQIILPMADNSGQSLAETMIKARDWLVSQFGGVTISEAQGAWHGPRGVQCEDVWRLTVAYAPNAHNNISLFRIAKWLCGEARQECVYTRFADGRVHLIDNQATEQEVAA